MSKDAPENKFTDISEFVKSFDKDIQRPNCKLCNSKLRKEAESMADRGTSMSSILRFLEQGGETISYGAVNNHINYHFKNQQSETDLFEYAGQLEKWSKMSRADDVMLNRYIVMLDMEAAWLGAKNANIELSERRKNDEVILKITNQITALKETLRSLHAELTPIEILFSSLDRIIDVKLKSGITQEARKALQDVIEQLKKEVGEVAVEGKKQEA